MTAVAPAAAPDPIVRFDRVSKRFPGVAALTEEIKSRKG